MLFRSDESDNFKDGTFQTRYDTGRDTISMQNDLTITDNDLLSLGLDYQYDRVDSTTAYAVTSRDNKGLFAQIGDRRVFFGAYMSTPIEVSTLSR